MAVIVFFEDFHRYSDNQPYVNQLNVPGQTLDVIAQRAKSQGGLFVGGNSTIFIRQDGERDVKTATTLQWVPLHRIVTMYELANEGQPGHPATGETIRLG